MPAGVPVCGGCACGKPLQLLKASTETTAKPQASFLAPWRVVIQALSKARTSAHSTQRRGQLCGPGRKETGGASIPRAVVTRLAVGVWEPFAARVSLLGETVQVELSGAPVQLNVTVPVKPLTEVRVAV